MTTLVQAISDGFAAVGTKLGQMYADMGWRRLSVASDGSWGGAIYILEQRSGAWRIRKIAADGTASLSASVDSGNAGLTQATAWAQRTSLIYV